jgi:hypothetical protein
MLPFFFSLSGNLFFLSFPVLGASQEQAEP